MDSVKLINSRVAAKLLGIKPQTLRVYRLRGSGPPYRRLGETKNCRVIYELEDVMNWIFSHSKVKSTSEESVITREAS